MTELNVKEGKFYLSDLQGLWRRRQHTLLCPGEKQKERDGEEERKNEPEDIKRN